MLRRIISFFNSKEDDQATEDRAVINPAEVRVIPRSEHPISRTDISDNALKVLYRLNKAGYEAYLVGGCVRDLCLGLKPKDFDVCTNANPEQIKALFRNCRLVGRRFRLAHILFGREIIEVATFRGHHDEKKNSKISQQDQEGMLTRDNVYGSMEEDVERRDFSVNALYYSVKDFAIHDHVGGAYALKERLITMIGDPETRYREDPVRMIRAVRFSAKLDMEIEANTAAPIYDLAPLLRNIPAARLFDEVLKLLCSGQGLATYKQLREYGLFQQLFPILKPFLTTAGDSKEERLIEQVLINTDERIRDDKRITPAYLYAALLWYPVEENASAYKDEGGLPYHEGFSIAMNEVLAEQCKSIMIPKRFSTATKEIWQLQTRLPSRHGRRAYRLAEHPRFRAAYDFLLTRGQVEGGEIAELAAWWNQFVENDDTVKQSLLRQLNKTSPGPKRRRKPFKKRKPAAKAKAE